MVKRSKKRTSRFGLLAVHILLVAVIAVFVVNGTGSTTTASQKALLSTTNEASATTALDQLSSADVAVQVASLTRLEEAVAVANNADSINAQLAIVSADDKVVAKPQIVSTNLKSRKDITSYTAVQGDTVSSVAAKFGVTSDTIRWSNNLNSEAIRAGTELTISPVNGIVYTVRDGDSIDSIASRFRANKNDLIAYNDAELTGNFNAGEKIIIKDGSIPAPTRPVVRSVASFPWGGGNAVYGGNGYDYGYCTWWSALRRSQIGRPIPNNLGNAITWKTLAQRAGLGVGTTPAAGAVIWFPRSGGLGHVGFVEEVLPDGSVKISEMNAAGWARVSHQTLSPSAASSYWYIY